MKSTKSLNRLDIIVDFECKHQRVQLRNRMASNNKKGRSTGNKNRAIEGHGDSTGPFPIKNSHGKENYSSANEPAWKVDLLEKFFRVAEDFPSEIFATHYQLLLFGLIVLRYFSEAPDCGLGRLAVENGDHTDLDRELPTKSLADHGFRIPSGPFWPYLLANSRHPAIGKLVDAAMVAIEGDNPRLKNILPKENTRHEIDQECLGKLIDLVGTIGSCESESQSGNILRQAFESLLENASVIGGKKNGILYTPPSVASILVEILAPSGGKVYDPCCGPAEMLVGVARFSDAHLGSSPDGLSFYGQEINSTIRRLAAMRLAIHGIEVDLGPESADALTNDQHPGLRADFIISRLIFQDKNWFRHEDDVRWKFGLPPKTKPTYAWVQHVVYHLAPAGMAGFVLGNHSMFGGSVEQGIRKELVEADLVDCIVALPGALFYGTGAPACLWVLAKDKYDDKSRDRRRETLFINAMEMGTPVNGGHRRELSESDIAKIAGTYHAWRGAGNPKKYVDIIGFCKAATTDEIASHGYSLQPAKFIAWEDSKENQPKIHSLHTINSLLVESPKGIKSIDLLHGSVLDAKSDLLVLSTHFRMDLPVSGQVVGAFQEKFQVEINASREWLKIAPGIISCIQDLPNGLPYRKLLIMRIADSRSQPDPAGFYVAAVQGTFASIAALEFMGEKFETVSMPVLSGQRLVNYGHAVSSLLDSGTGWLRISEWGRLLRFFVFNAGEVDEWKKAMDLSLGRLYLDLGKKSVLKGLCLEVCSIARQETSCSQMDKICQELVGVLEHPDRVSPQVVAMYGRKLAERIAALVCSHYGLPVSDILINNIEQIAKLKKISTWVLQYLHTLRVFGNESVHSKVEQKLLVPKELDHSDMTSILSSIRSLLSFHKTWNNLKTPIN